MSTVQEQLGVLKDQPLRFLFRAMDMLCLEFGEIIEKPVMSKDDNGKAILIQEKAGIYSLHVQSIYRLSCGNETILAKRDIFLPSIKAIEELALEDGDDIPDDFDYQRLGNNRLDEIISAKMGSVDKEK